jgi:hypothetical protein
MKYFLLLLLPLFAFAQDPMELTEEELNPDAEEILIKKPEKYLRNESMIYDFDTDLGIKDQRQYTGQDRNKVSLAAHISSDYEHFNNLIGLEFSYMHRSTRYNQIWYGFQFFQHNTTFDSITKNQTVETGDTATDESAFQRPGDTKNTVMGLGLGVGYRFKLLLDFFQTEDMFESIDVYANYIRLNETFIKKDYSGYGLTTNYGLHKRVNTSFFYGGKLSYNLSYVKREKLGTESEKNRSLALGWLSLAFELGFFF